VTPPHKVGGQRKKRTKKSKKVKKYWISVYVSH
jgi:hypothetical protein